LYTLILGHVLEDWGEPNDCGSTIRLGSGWRRPTSPSCSTPGRSGRHWRTSWNTRCSRSWSGRPTRLLGTSTSVASRAPTSTTARAEMTRNGQRLTPALPLQLRQAVPGRAGSPRAHTGRFRGVARRPPAPPVLDDCASLRGRADRLRLQARAMRSAQVQTHAGATIAMPRARISAWSSPCRPSPVSGTSTPTESTRRASGHPGENPQPLVNVARDPHPQCSAELEREFVRALYGLLKPVHDHNARPPTGRPRRPCKPTLTTRTSATGSRTSSYDAWPTRRSPRLPFRSSSTSSAPS